MEYVIAAVIALVIGLALGAGVVWLVLRTRIKTAYDQARAEQAATQATLQERLNARDQTLAEVNARLVKAESDALQLNLNLQAEVEKRVAAEKEAERIPQLQNDLAAKESEVAEMRTKVVKAWTEQAELKKALEAEQAATAEKLALIEGAKAELSNTFKAISADILRDNSQSFLNLAKSTIDTYQESARGDLELRRQSIAELLEPIKSSLSRFDQEVRTLEQTRVSAFEGLRQQIGSLLDANHQLKAETNNLVTALRQPQVRGRWGEIQLRRVVEMAGMVEYCDFVEQQSVSFDGSGGVSVDSGSNSSSSSSRQRPDMVVRLPGNKSVVVDSKAPLAAYLEALEAGDDATRQQKLKQHAVQIKTHLAALGRKGYWEQFQPAPEFVVLFLPGETFFSAALEQDPALIEAGVEQGVILATPTTLIALLRAVAYGWRQESVTQNALEISKLGRELYKSVTTLTSHWTELGKSLKKTTEAYNEAVGSLERNVLAKARRFKELKVGVGEEKAEIALLSPVETSVRPLVAPELAPPSASILPASSVEVLG